MRAEAVPSYARAPWVRRWLFAVTAVFICGTAAAADYVLACGSWDATTSTFTAYDVGGGAAPGACPSANQIFVDVDDLNVGMFSSFSVTDGLQLGGAVLGLWALAWAFGAIKQGIRFR